MQDLEPADRKWDLTTKLLTGELTSEEQAEWEEFMQDREFKHQVEMLQQHWGTMGTLPYAQIDKEHDWKIVLQKIAEQETPKRKLLLPSLLRYAAAITALLVISFFIWKIIPSKQGELTATVIEAPHGARTSVKLPDSSTVWLNAGSKISFNQYFGKDNRDITMEGEAFFDVKKSMVPFHIQTPAYTIAVLGTAFNVKAYQDDDLVSTTLLRGSLKVSRIKADGKEEEFLLQPNDKVILRGTAQQRDSMPIILEKNIDALADSEWKDGWLTVRGESLGDLSKKIERLYNVKINFEDERLKTYRYTGRIQEFSLEQVLNALALTSPLKFSVHEKNVTLSINELTRSKYHSLQTP